MRKVNIISRQKISQLPVHSVSELLEHITGVDIRQRGAKGVQADLNMQGSNFEQVLICLNGVRINDPQTGHHNMDLPVNLMDIERIEILPGGGSNIYGPNAFSGAINIVTRKPITKGVELEISGGNFGLSSQHLSLNYPLEEFKNRFSFTRKKSSGYRPDTDFEISSLSFDSQREFEFGTLEYLFGYTDKDFGADSFYSNLYPHEEEHTDTRFFNLKAHIKSKILELKGDLYFRRHADKFILDRNRPDWYVNYHTTYTYGTGLSALKEFDFGSLEFGGEINQEKITSTRLGNHSRDNQALYTQFQSPLEKSFIYNLGLRMDHYQTWGWQTSPGVSIGYRINPQLKLKFSFGRSFRIPSFTDLYYQSPANVGNQDLTPEKAWSHQVGLDFSMEGLSSELTYYRRWANDLIGWTRTSSTEAWSAQNIAEVDTHGIQIDLSLKDMKDKSFVSEIYGGYIYQYLETDSLGLNTKYTLDFMKHHANIGMNLSLPWNLKQNLTLSYKQRIDQRPYFVLDSRISKEMKKDEFVVEIFVDMSNLLNTSYSEQGSTRMPGRWIIGGVRVRL